MLAGNIQIAIAAPAAVLRANLGGSDFVYIELLAIALILSVITRDGIKSVQELRGKKIAIGNFGSGTDYAGRLVFDKLGMQVGKDIIFTQILGDSRHGLPCSNRYRRRVFSARLSPCAHTVGFRPCWIFSSVIPHFSLGYFTRRSYIRDNPRVVENSLKGLLDAPDTFGPTPRAQSNP